MKKTFALFSLITFCSMSISAQVFRVGLLGVGVGGGQNSGRLAVHIFEAAYAPSPRVDFGGYWGVAVAGDTESASAGFRYGAQSKFYLMTGKFKPFVGLQLGLNTGAKVEEYSEKIATGIKFQVTPQAGFRFGPLNIWASYQSGFMVNGGFVFGFGKFDN
jgi:hypothetical protein